MIKDFCKRIFIENWQRKGSALLLSIIIWLLVSNSITTAKTLHNIPIKVINIPQGMTIEGIAADGTLDRTITLTISGSKKDIDRITSKDIEILINASGKGSEWIVSLRKTNLISLNPAINIQSAITGISHSQLIMKLSRLVKEQIEVYITRPLGNPPEGYQFIDIWPKVLNYTLSGPEEIINKIKAKGLKLTFNLNDITEKELNAIAQSPQNLTKDEISFPVPESWKQVHIPYLNTSQVSIDSQNANFLRIDFLKNSLIPIDTPLPINVFYPLKSVNTYNPQTLTIQDNAFVKNEKGVFALKLPLFAYNSSTQFVDIVRDHLLLTISPIPDPTTHTLPWSIQFINIHELETRYIQLIEEKGLDRELLSLPGHLREEYLRKRFRSYLYLFQVYVKKNTPLNLNISLNKDKIVITQQSSAS